MRSQKRTSACFGAVLLTASVGILVAASGASGQAAIDQYVPDSNPAASSSGRTGDATVQRDDVNAAGSDRGGRKRNGAVNQPIQPSGQAVLPSTSGGYPLTPFVIAVLALAAVAAAIGIGVAVRRNRG